MLSLEALGYRAKFFQSGIGSEQVPSLLLPSSFCPLQLLRGTPPSMSVLQQSCGRSGSALGAWVSQLCCYSGRGDSKRRIVQFMQGLQVEGAEKGLYRMEKRRENDEELVGNMSTGRN